MERTTVDWYRWRRARNVIKVNIERSGTPEMLWAWRLAAKFVEEQATVYFSALPRELAMAAAWEDFEMACRGVGQPGVAGGIFMLWSRTPLSHELWLHQTLSRAFADAVLATSAEALRYPLVLRRIPIATLDDGFGLPEVPATGAFGGIPDALYGLARFDGPNLHEIEMPGHFAPRPVFLMPSLMGEH